MDDVMKKPAAKIDVKTLQQQQNDCLHQTTDKLKTISQLKAAKSLMLGKAYFCIFSTLLRLVKSAQSLQSPDFFLTITIGKAQGLCYAPRLLDSASVIALPLALCIVQDLTGVRLCGLEFPSGFYIGHHRVLDGACSFLEIKDFWKFFLKIVKETRHGR